MPTFQNKKFYGSADMGKAGVRYRALLEKRPFLAFGLPFLAVIVAGSFALTPSTAVRYERQDRKVRQMTREEELSIGREKRKVDMREEYYVSSFFLPSFTSSSCLQSDPIAVTYSGLGIVLRCGMKELGHWGFAC